jgi:alkylation response protein AidB-like acyl-CoA dehydrogenase
MPFDFSLSDAQELLAREAVRVVDELVPFELARQATDHRLERSRSVWQQLARLGWAGLCLAGAGAGLGATELMLVAEALGRRAAPLPFIWHNAAGRYLSRSPVAGRHRGIVHALAEGTAIATIAHWEAGDRSDNPLPAAQARLDGGRVYVRGSKRFVPFATLTDYFLTSVAVEGAYGLVLLPRETVTVHPYPSTGRDGRATVTFDTCLDADFLLGTGEAGLIQDVLDFARVGLCAYATGASQAALDMTATYAKDRVIFGRPLGSFQAVQHRCADMLFDLEAGRVLTLEAAWQIDTGRPAHTAVAAACAYVGAGAQRILAHAHQIHGAIGFTYEHDLPLLSTVVKATAADLGREDVNREVVASSLGI